MNSIDRQKRKRTSTERYSVALLVTLGALIITLIIRPMIKLSNFNLFQGAVFLSAWYGGLGPGIVTSILSIALIDYFLVPPVFAFSFAWIDGGINMAVFGAVALIMSSLSARLRTAQSELQTAHDDLEVRIRERTEELSDSNRRLNAEITERLEAEKAILEVSSREQRRMGEDLHDGLCQMLTGIRLLADVLSEKLAARSLPEVAVVDKIETRLSEAIAQADNISRGLYPVELETNGLMAALHEMTRNMKMMYPITCTFISRKDVLVEDSAVATHLFRIAQEAVVNAIKGGKAKNIVVRLFNWRFHGLLIVADDGIGFAAAEKRQGMGLKLMDCRARMIGGMLKFRDRLHGGTLVCCDFSMTPSTNELHHGL